MDQSRSLSHHAEVLSSAAVTGSLANAASSVFISQQKQGEFQLTALEGHRSRIVRNSAGEGRLRGPAR
jgi:hypothetical protein